MGLYRVLVLEDGSRAILLLVTSNNINKVIKSKQRIEKIHLYIISFYSEIVSFPSPVLVPHLRILVHLFVNSFLIYLLLLILLLHFLLLLVLLVILISLHLPHLHSNFLLNMQQNQ